MFALLAEKAWHSRQIDLTKEKLKALSALRTGLFVKPESFCIFKLLHLLQEIAAAKIDELKLLFLIDQAEKKLRFELDGEVLIGSAAKIKTAPKVWGLLPGLSY